MSAEQEMEDLKRTEDRLRRLLSILQHSETSIQDFLTYALTQAIQLTSSEFGCLYLYSSDGQYLDGICLQSSCRASNLKDLHCLETTEAWRKAIEQRAPEINNEANSLLNSINRFAIIPVINEDNILVGMLSLVNRGENYTETDTLEVSLLFQAVWKTVERKRIENELRISEVRFRSLYENMVEGVAVHELVFDADHNPIDYRIIAVNPAFESILKLPASKVVGKLSTEVYNGDTPYLDVYSKVATTGVPATFESFVPLFNQHFSISAYCPHINTFATVFRDITERKQVEEQLYQLANTDPLTEISNRRHILENADRELKLAKRKKTPLGIIMFDIDKFKQVNDYGHATGDLALISVVAACKTHLRETDLFGRLGGDEFLIILPDQNKERTLAVAERLRQAIEDIHMHSYQNIDLTITCSFGVTVATETADTIDKLLVEADTALLQGAKRCGRNSVWEYSTLLDLI